MFIFLKFGESAAFVRSDDPALFPKSEYPETLPDSTSGSGSPDLELFTTPLAYKVRLSHLSIHSMVSNVVTRNMVPFSSTSTPTPYMYIS